MTNSTLGRNNSKVDMLASPELLAEKDYFGSQLIQGNIKYRFDLQPTNILSRKISQIRIHTHSHTYPKVQPHDSAVIKMKIASDPN